MNRPGVRSFEIAGNQSVTFGRADGYGYPGQTVIAVADLAGNPLSVGTISKDQTVALLVAAQGRRITLSGNYWNWDHNRFEDYQEGFVRLTERADGTGYDWACDDNTFGVDFKNFVMPIVIQTIPWANSIELSSGSGEDRQEHSSIARLIPLVAVLRLDFDESVQVTISSDKTWSCPGDPHQVLPDNSGTWDFAASSGTNLRGESGLLVQIVDWKLYSAFKGEKGGAHLVAGEADTFGAFEVATVG